MRVSWVFHGWRHGGSAVCEGIRALASLPAGCGRRRAQLTLSAECRRSGGRQTQGNQRRQRSVKSLRDRRNHHANGVARKPEACPGVWTFSGLRSGARERPSARPRPAVCLKTAQVSPNGTEASWRFAICDMRWVMGDVRCAGQPQRGCGSTGGTCHNPVGVVSAWRRVPRVGPGRANPGL